MRNYALFAIAILLGLLQRMAAADEHDVRELFRTHCDDCHGAATQKGGLRLDTLPADFSATESFASWMKIHDKLRRGEMPPRDSDQPSSRERQVVVDWLAARLTAADIARRHAEGRVVLRRLNRTEYENTLRDLFELSGLPVKELLPEDGRAHGFDKSAAGLDLSYVQLAKYMEAADVALDSDFTMLNQRLADHYHIAGVVGSAMRRVALPADNERGGFMTHASVLKVTANGTVTSPVTRGAWVMRKIIGRPPDPPPGDVPAIDPDIRGTTTIREMLAAHRSNAACAACHAKIDPPGFALESFDVIGGWQTRYRSLNEEGEAVDKSQTYSGRRVPYTWGPPVDAAGETADGRAFSDIDEFKALLLEDRRAIARNLVGQLVTYATGSPIEFADRTAVEQVLDKTASREYGVRSLIHEIVQSTLFQTK